VHAQASREPHGWFIQAFEARQLATYGANEVAGSDPAPVGTWIERAEVFVNTIREYLKAP
jgi:hypothetical protein